MKSRLIRPAMTALVSGALVAGAAVYASPALAEEPSTPATVTESESPVPSSPTSVEPSDSASPVPSSPTSVEPSGSVSAEPSVFVPPSSEPPVPDPSDSASSSESPLPSQSPVKDTTAPTKANFKLNYTAVWLGQVVTFTQTAADLADPTDPTSALSRVVNWGDGTTTTLAASTTTVRKTYTRSGSFKVVVTVADPAGNRLVTPAKTVAVTTATGTVSVSTKSPYHGQRFQVKVAKVPAGATSYRIDWSDGWPSTHKAKNGVTFNGVLLYDYKWDAALGRYVKVSDKKITGKRSLKISWYNAKGYSVNQTVVTLNVLKDSWKPKLTITKPSSGNKASSWKTIKGTVSDKGAGLRHLGVTVVRVTSSNKWYCLTQANKWKRITSDSQMAKYCYNNGVEVKISKGKWTLKPPAGIAKNQQIWVEAWAYDGANLFKDTYRTAKITRS